MKNKTFIASFLDEGTIRYLKRNNIYFNSRRLATVFDSIITKRN